MAGDWIAAGWTVGCCVGEPRSAERGCTPGPTEAGGGSSGRGGIAAGVLGGASPGRGAGGAGWPASTLASAALTWAATDSLSSASRGFASVVSRGLASAVSRDFASGVSRDRFASVAAVSDLPDLRAGAAAALLFAPLRPACAEPVVSGCDCAL